MSGIYRTPLSKLEFHNKEVIKRARYLFTGIVQGVGFRPFIYRLAVRLGLAGFVQNRPDGVLVEVQGPKSSIHSFFLSVNKELPPLASITGCESLEIAVTGDKEFKIILSENEGLRDVHIAPDSAVCSDCLKELFDPADRRFHYPFINCTNCGSRLTIINDIPYDRGHTSMACFDLCPNCRTEYENPADRRFHAEPNACPVCGPQLELRDSDGEIITCDDPVEKAIELIAAGHVLAIKGLGGFHLCVDATSDTAVKKLRLRKYREEKPLAIMVRDIEQARLIAEINDEEKALLSAVQRPIVLLKKRENAQVSILVAPSVPNLGIMLPYAPLHYLLLENKFLALVMTSANQVDEPICIGNREALARLKGIADYFLVHNRDILVRCDDSIAFVTGGKSQLMRRSRGYTPRPLILRESFPSVLALGPQIKATQCILKDNFAFLSPHIGDLETPQARDFFHESLALMKKITQSDPQIIACDYHPAYYSTKVAQELKASRVIPVQHHHAHIVSCMAENQIDGDVIGLAMDGTGYGLDSNAWGGEFLIASATRFRRFGHLQYFVLPGGEKAIHEPWRIGVSLLKQAYSKSWPEIASGLKLIPDKTDLTLFDMIIEKRLNSPLSSGLGRLFDGVAAIMGLRSKVSFEGQAAMELEAKAKSAGLVLPFDILRNSDESYILDISTTIRAIVENIFDGKSVEETASAFHATLIAAFVAMSDEMRKVTGINRVALSGGCFQNRLLLEGSVAELKNNGFDVYCHCQIPTNDGGVSLGQAVIAGSIIKKEK
jgi:hydrogenase maturation protein HypF